MADRAYTDEMWDQWRSGTLTGVQLEIMAYIRSRVIGCSATPFAGQPPTAVGSLGLPGLPVGAADIGWPTLTANRSVMMEIFDPSWADVLAIITAFTAMPDAALPQFITATADPGAAEYRAHLRYEQMPRSDSWRFYRELDRSLNAAALTIAHRLGAAAGDPFGLPYDEEEAAGGLVVIVAGVDLQRHRLHVAVHDAVESAITSACCPRYSATEHDALHDPWRSIAGR